MNFKLLFFQLSVVAAASVKVRKTKKKKGGGGRLTGRLLTFCGVVKIIFAYVFSYPTARKSSFVVTSLNNRSLVLARAQR